ncbi:MAG: 4Fe-4S binding protein [bacterium]
MKRAAALRKTSGRPRTRLKWTFQALSCALFLFLFFAIAYPLPYWVPRRLFLSLDPLAALVSPFGARSFPLLAAVCLASAFVFGRAFCGYVCPLGLCIDLARLGTGAANGVRPEKDEAVRRPPAIAGSVAPPRRRFGGIRGLEWVLLAVLVLGILLGSGLPYVLDPIVLMTRALAVAFFPGLVWAGNELLQLIRPLLEQAGWYGVAYLSFAQPGFRTAVPTLLLLAGILMLSLLAPRFWCRFLCPAGALLSVPARFSLTARRVGDACVQCGRCRSVCPMGAVGQDPARTRRSLCLQCTACREACPTGAISYPLRVPWAGAFAPASADRAGRRFLLGLGAGSAALFLTSIESRVMKRPGRVLRPPGAIPEDDFLTACIRCDACLRVCVTRTLRASAIDNGLIRWGTPVHRMRTAGCEQTCNLCGKVCPTGAIRDLPLIERQHAKIGTAVLRKERCLAWAQDRLCLLCDEACPYNAIVFQVVEGKKRPFVDPSRCNGCGICESVCPVEGDAAIQVVPDGEVRLRSGSYRALLEQSRILLEPKKDRLDSADGPGLNEGER